nr:PREDICTED: syndetin [Bemisia tabaci]
MENLKNKVLGLINKQGSEGKIPIISFDQDASQFFGQDEDEPPLPSVSTYTDENRKCDTEILESINPDYFQNNGFDACAYELEKLPEVLDVYQLQQNIKTLRQQQIVVSKKVYQLILDKHRACEEEIKKIQVLQQDLNDALGVCRTSRGCLKNAKRLFTTTSLGILANYRKRTLTQDLLKSLLTIKTLLRTQERLEDLLSQEDFAGAIGLLIKCQQVSSAYQHFTCVAALEGKLKDTLVLVEEQLDVALAKMCCDFKHDVYSKLQAAYSQLGKTQMAINQLHMHFISTVHSAAFNVVHARVGQKQQYSTLCESLPDNELLPCLRELCRALWHIVLSYHKVVVWHRENSADQNPASEEADLEKSFHEEYVKQKLENGLSRLWTDIQSKVTPLIFGADLASFKFDDFLQVLAIIHRLVIVGEEFCGSESSELKNSVRTQSSNYFRRYHASRLEELKLFLENEIWTPCPVKSDFTLLQLQEFKSLRLSIQTAAGRVRGRQASSGNIMDNSFTSGTNYFTHFSESGSPFDSALDTSVLEEDILDNETEGSSNYYSDDSEDESTHTNTKKTHNHIRNHSSPLITNTTLTVLRLCGRYLQMSRLLQSVAPDAIHCLGQLFEYYLYAVFSFFTADPPTGSVENVTSVKLQAVIKRIQENFLQSDASGNGTQVNKPVISPVVDLQNAETLYGLNERVVAVESLVFLAEQYDALRPYLEQLIPAEDPTVHVLNQLYSQTVASAVDVRRPVYSCVAWRAVDTQHILSLMSKTNWEIKDVMSQHSPYVDVLVREFQIFAMKLDALNTHLNIPQAVHNVIWECISFIIASILVEGFSSSKRCSNGGRALMQLDLTQLVSKLEAMSSLKPVPHKEFVETYVKAYYLSEPTLETWVKDHTEYSPKQLIALVSCVCAGNKKNKQRLINCIEEMDR